MTPIVNRFAQGKRHIFRMAPPCEDTESVILSAQLHEEALLDIVGVDGTARDPMHVHTIDVWFSDRRRAWIVERLNAEGHVVGLAFVTSNEREARDCAAHWLRAHTETYLATPSQQASTTRKRAARPSRRAA